MSVGFIIADDHPIVRSSVRLQLERMGLLVLAEVGNGEEALNCVKLLGPAVLILDLGIPVVDGLSVIARIYSEGIPVKIIVFTGQQSINLMSYCRQAGAHGFVSKKNNLFELFKAVKFVLAGADYFPGLGFPSIKNNRRGIESLSCREKNVFLKLVSGMSNKEIASCIGVNSKTVSTYKARLMKKLSAKNLRELIDIGFRNGTL